MELVKEIKSLSESAVKDKVDKRLQDFKAFKNYTDKEWFSELCFCLLTANSKAQTAINIQQELGYQGFYNYDSEEIIDSIKRNKHRFHNNKTRYILESRKNHKMKSIIEKLVEESGEKDARRWLAKNIKGLGFKEASHFMRNVGYENLAILDRHIINLMLESGHLEQRPKTLDEKTYLHIEERLKQITKDLDMNMAEIDLYMWYMKTGKILK